MEKERNIKRYSGAELDALREKGESRTDLARVQAKTEEELLRDIASDPDFSDVPENWYENAQAVMPVPKRSFCRFGSTATSSIGSRAKAPATRHGSMRSCAPMSRRPRSGALDCRFEA
jgi:hypothetical protein